MSEANYKDLHFLVTDDYASMRETIAEDLKKLGVTKVTFAVSGTDALKKLTEALKTPTPIQFIMTDLMMPDGDGIFLVSNVRKNPEIARLPILMVTSKAEISHILDAVRAGVDSYIVKPWQIEDLSKKIVDSYTKKR